MSNTPKVNRRKWKLQPDPSKVICRPHIPFSSPGRITRIINHVLAMPDENAKALHRQLTQDFSDRHRNLLRTLQQNFEQVKPHIPDTYVVDDIRRELIGAYFTMEYSVTSAALFNPSIVSHPDQSGLESGHLRFVMSLRGVGEGHISSIIFSSGVIGAAGNILFDPETDYVEAPIQHLESKIDKNLFGLKLSEMNRASQLAKQLLDRLPAQFSYTELQVKIDELIQEPGFQGDQEQETIAAVNWLANSNYDLRFPTGHPISERVIFPTSEDNSRGIEDARFVAFHEDNGDMTYYATYTAYNGSSILPQLIETKNFEYFKIITLNGSAVQNKGMALFPRKINNQYVMLSRQDGENNHIMYSDHLHFWHHSEIIQEPKEPWEFVQIGNCGSPLETSEGWLVLTHGVGPMREYSIGAILLDLNNPSRLVARLEDPLISPHEHEREGYVPNVVYSCGALIFKNELIIPYAMSDISSGLASVNIQELFACMVPVP